MGTNPAPPSFSPCCSRKKTHPHGLKAAGADPRLSLAAKARRPRASPHAVECRDATRRNAESTRFFFVSGTRKHRARPHPCRSRTGHRPLHRRHYRGHRPPPRAEQNEPLPGCTLRPPITHGDPHRSHTVHSSMCHDRTIHHGNDARWTRLLPDRLQCPLS